MMRQRETRAMTLYMEDDGIVRVNLNGNVLALELADAQEAVRMVASLGDGVRVPVLVNMRALRNLNRDCRNYFASAETAKVQSAAALIVDSPLTRAIGNFFMGINKTMIPTRLFTAEPDAVAWLKTFVR